MTSSPLFWRLFVGYLLVHAVLVAGLLWLVGRTQRNQLVGQVETRLQSICENFQLQLSNRSSLELDEVQQLAAQVGAVNNVRLTIITTEGDVVADTWTTDLSAMQSHSNRIEVQQAIKTGRGASYRYSTTESRYMLYYCVGPKNLASLKDSVPPDRNVEISPVPPSPAPFLIRSAVDDSLIQRVVGRLRQTVFAYTLLVGVLGCVATYILANRLIKPLDHLMVFAQDVAEGKLTAGLDLKSSQPEWDRIRSAFLHMQSELSSREKKLRDYTHRLEAILGSMVEGVIAVRRSGEVLFANGAARNMLSLQRNDFVGRPLHEIVRYPELLNGFDRAVSKGESVKAEFETRGENRRIVSIRITCLQDNPSAGTVIVARDVTELRQLETMRSDFVANVSHELKTPLAAIKAYAETLRLGAMDDKENRTRFLDEIEEQAERLYRLIMDLIQLARIESKQTVFETEPVELVNVMLQSIESFTPVAKSRNLTLNLEAPKSLLFRSDAEGLRTILDNLISNAIRYTPGGGEINVRGWQSEDEIGFEVQDTGIGIASEYQVRIFERFYRVDKARSRDLGGTGLGLSIVKHLCQALGGHVDLESRVGYGSLFRISFPLHHPLDEPLSAPQLAPPADSIQ